MDKDTESYSKTYQDGFRDGIKEVVDWVKENDPEVWSDWQSCCVWQSKFKEWGF